MNSYKRHDCKAFTLIELLVVISIIALLVSILMPALNKAREQAKSVLCKQNLKQMQIGMIYYTNDHDGKTFPHYASVVFIEPIMPYVDDAFDILLCPSANTKKYERPDGSNGGSSKQPWLWRNAMEYNNERIDVQGSYAINGFAYNKTAYENDNKTYKMQNEISNNSGFNAADYPTNFFYDAWFSSLEQCKRPQETPGYIDAMWPDTWPLAGNEGVIVQDETELIWGTCNSTNSWRDNANYMKRICLDRHTMKVNSSFLDGHVESVELEKLWTLKWHNFFKPRYDGLKMP